ncbi:late control protein [Riemerella columbipharyngis]|uniref:Phage protein D n=1 Tax=Riemerella columbipharyngis TaxID=1071918 RepID=A0A1G7FMK4_9FLAO|nr:late control protein [Riemerella columbipharyngis]SDE77103.1 hypothetical protein SAMN05421544_12422 [Riemerella columbipharyngis]
MFILKGHITIGGYDFKAISEVEITHSVDDLSDTATIKMPAKFKVRQTGEEKYTEEAIKVGDKVSITLGYEDVYESVEFNGFVASIGSKIPLEIKCEDAIWKLRRKNITKAFGKVTLKSVLSELVSGTGVELADNIPNYTFDKLIIKDANGAKVLEDLKKNHCLTAFINDEGKLYVGLQLVTNIGQSVVYDLNYNIVENNLEYKTAEQKKIKVKYTYIAKDNKRTTVEVGDDGGEQRTFTTSIVSDENKLREMAKAELKKLKYDGFEGSVKSFLVPYATRGMTAVIKDKEHLNREGKYFIKKVVTSFGDSGARRTIHISNKL